VKTHAIFSCRSCGARAPRWQGRCATCAEWNTIDEIRATNEVVQHASVSALCDVTSETGTHESSGLDEVDRVLGGGFVPGSTTLLFGEPGVGKSTLALMMLRELATRGQDVLLIAAEESASQVASRARRFGPIPPSLAIAITTDVKAATSLLGGRPRALTVVDSISAMSDDSIGGIVGSVSQVRHAAERLSAVAKATNAALLFIGHVTKEGELAGPRALEHLVDTVVRIEGDRHGSLRVLRAQKHRFGPTGEVGLFEMVSDGLREVRDASLLRGSSLNVPGVVLTVTNDGSRSFLVEIQALVAQSTGSSRRIAHQLSSQRLSLLLAVLEARVGVDTSALDVFAATAGGLSAIEPGVDVAIALAVASAVRGFVVPSSTIVLGEVGLAGELRAIAGLTRRVREAQRLGARRVIAPLEGDLDEVDGIAVVRVGSLAEAMDVVERESSSTSSV
jgi:DNA repair protein RadA/Sms